jgi:hypothetical protein
VKKINSELRMARCSARTRRGSACRFPAARGTDRCLNHAETADTSANATRAAIARHSPSKHLLETVLSLTDRASIQAVLDTLIRLEFAGRISHERARVIVRACGVASRNFDRTIETLDGPKPPEHDWFPYFQKVQSLLETVDPLLDEANANDDPA